MADDATESKAKKLAAARKKLKEYQSRNMESGNLTSSMTSVASSERSETEISIEENTPSSMVINQLDTPPLIEQTASLANYFSAPAKELAFELNQSVQSPAQQQQQQQPAMDATTSFVENVASFGNANGNAVNFETPATTFQLNEQFQQQQHLNAMQLLIAEKTQLTAELNRWRSLCREKDADLDDLRTQLQTRNQEFEDFQHNFKQQQQSTEQLRKQNAELMHKLSQSHAAQEDQQAHLHELQQQLKLVQAQVIDLELKFNEKCKEHELAQLRIQQLSDESKDERADAAATQNQFMYEQQIRDLQAMVQQFTQDKEQSSIQYQNYVQHLNAEVTKMKERNSDLSDTCTQLQERERQLVEHISELEREIQKNLSLRQTAEENQTPKAADVAQPTTTETVALKHQITTLEERLSEFDFERHEFQLKIKSQEDRLVKLQAALNEKEAALENISQHLPEQTDQVKLLAAMESDKIAASRAVGQNIKLKQQLDEMEMRFVQLTNDKAELTIQLDKEAFEKRTLAAKVEEIETSLKSLDEKFQNKDEEMIRLSHENMELKQKNLMLQQQNDHLKHNKVHNYRENDKTIEGQKEDEAATNDAHEAHKHSLHQHHHHDHDHDHHDHDHEHHHHHDNEDHAHTHKHEHQHTPTACNHDAETDACQEAHEIGEEKFLHKKLARSNNETTTPHIATAEAVEKLQTRFTYLMSQVANLTDEKEKLEHLVMQLQDETETIGEYIALYQTQRRILKQREYEKAAQTRLLQEEREKLREKVAQLNELVSKLGLLEKTTNATGMTHDDNIKSQLQAALAESVSIEPQHDDNFVEQQKHVDNIGDATLIQQQQYQPVPAVAANELLMQIQNIVTEIKENTTRDLPLLDAKTNNAIEICHCCEGQLKVV